MFQIDYFYRWNERIVAPTQGDGGVSGDGAISEIIDLNLAPNRLLISDPSGKIIVSSLVTAQEAQTLQGIDTGETIQEQLDGKQNTLTIGDLSEATSSVLTITGGTGAIIGSGLSIQVKLAGSGQSGYLSTTDWNTFNNKLTGSLASAFVFVGNGSGVATGVAISGDIGITNTGVTSISAGVIVNADINASAAIARSKTASGTAYRILANNVSGVMSENAALTATRIIVADANGQLVASAATTTHATYISTLTSNAQTQLDTLIVGKATNALVQSPTASEDGFAITWSHGAQEWQLTDPVIQGIPVAGSTSQVLMKDSGADYDASWTSLLLSHISNVNASAVDVDVLVGAAAASVTPTIIGYLGTANPLSSPLQDQLDGKQSSSLAFNAIWIGNGSGIATQLSPGASGYVLTSVGGAPQWQPSLAGHIIESSGTPLTSRANLNFSNGLTASDNNPDTNVKLGGALTANTSISGTFDLELGTSGSPLSAFNVNSGPVTVDSSSQVTITAFSNLFLTAESDQVVISPATEIKVLNSGTPPSTNDDINSSYIYAKDVSASSEFFVMNENGTETKLSGNKGNAGGTLHVDTTTVGNVTGGEDDLKTYTVIADTLKTNGQSIVATCSGVYAANVNNKVIKVYFGSTLIFDSGSVSTSGAHWNLQIEIIRTGASAQKCIIVFNYNGLVAGRVAYITSAEDTTASINFRVTGESLASATDDIVSEMFKVKWEAESV